MSNTIQVNFHQSSPLDHETWRYAISSLPQTEISKTYNGRVVYEILENEYLRLNSFMKRIQGNHDLAKPRAFSHEIDVITSFEVAQENIKKLWDTVITEITKIIPETNENTKTYRLCDIALSLSRSGELDRAFDILKIQTIDKVVTGYIKCIIIDNMLISDINNILKFISLISEDYEYLQQICRRYVMQGNFNNAACVAQAIKDQEQQDIAFDIIKKRRSNDMGLL